MTEVVHQPSGSLALTEQEVALMERFPLLDPNSEIVELLAENVGDEEALTFSDLTRVTVPPGGALTWAIPDLEEGEIRVKEITGIVLKWETSRAYWENPEVTGNAPDCSSRDGKTPVPGGWFAADGDLAEENPGNACKDCPMNQFGSATKGQGKACKESKLLYVAEEGSALPTIVSVPPTSLRPLKTFLVQLATGKAKAKYTDVEIALGLKQAESGGQKYSVILPRMVRVLDPAERKLARGASDSFGQMLTRAPVAALAAGTEGADSAQATS